MGKTILIIIVLIFEITGLANIYLQYPAYPLSIIFFDVGQGDSVLIETSNKTKILVDTGPDQRIVEKMASISKIIDNKIDYVILTHPDMDHIGGMVGLLKNFEIENIILNFDFESDTKYMVELNQSIQYENANLINGFDTSDMYIDDCYFDFIWPKNDLNSQVTLSENDSSISLKISYKGFDLFLGGDISSKIEKIIGSDIQEVEVMKISHHGSNTSNGVGFLEILSPEYAIISVGKNNQYNHPAKNVINNLGTEKIKYFRTDYEGDIECKVKDNIDYSCFSLLNL
jgi:competence protein ComEC